MKIRQKLQQYKGKRLIFYMTTAILVEHQMITVHVLLDRSWENKHLPDGVLVTWIYCEQFCTTHMYPENTDVYWVILLFIPHINFIIRVCIYVTLSAKTRIVRTSMYIEKTKLKIICEITHVTGKYLQGLMGPAISKGSFKSTKTIYHLTRLAMESSKIFVLFL